MADDGARPQNRIVTRDRAPLRVLICGAGIAGATLAVLLGRAGHTVVVVERDQGVRSSGNPVDVRGAAFRIAGALGLVPRLNEVATQVRRLVVVDDIGRPVAAMPTTLGRDRELEVPRADLCAALVDAARSSAEIRFDDTVVAIEPGDAGALVSCERSGAERFDLVVGADGLHSHVRRLAFGPETEFVAPLGMYVATVPVPELELRPETVLLHNTPGAAAAVHPGAGAPGAFFLFRSRARIDVHDRDAAHALLAGTYGSLGWRIPELLAAYLSASDTYFDAVSRVRVARWSRGPIVLLGDAASCVSLFGDGSSAAIVGANLLATALERWPDLPTALARYEHSQRAAVRRGQRVAPMASHVLVPATGVGIRMRNAALRIAIRGWADGIS
ncbi:MAG: hypothetical protein QOE37_1938 [Microbacteriaceae bacterium]|nr:hypothetical protein [Microbacteriaceae bacterium]